METLGAYLPIIVVATTAFLGVATYAYQKRVDRGNALIDLRRAAYQEVLVALQKHLHEPSQQSLTDLSAARAQAFIVASDEVAKAMGKFFAASINEQQRQSPSGNEVLSAYADMIIAMRRDCFERTALTTREVVAISPVRWREVE